MPKRSDDYLQKRYALFNLQRQRLQLAPLPMPKRPVIIAARSLRPRPPTALSAVPRATSGTILGYDVTTKQPVYLGDKERESGLYVLGMQGVGKSTLLADYMGQDAERGLGFLLLDPHRELYEHVIRRIPAKREQDVIVLDVLDTAHPFGLNLLSCADPTNRELLSKTVSQALHPFLRLWGPDGEFPSWGARMEYLLKAAFRTLASHPGVVARGKGLAFTMAEMWALFELDEFRQAVIAALPADNRDRVLWERKFRPSWADSVENKTSFFVDEPVVEGIVGQSHSTVDFRAAMDEGKIILVPLDPQNREVTAVIGAMVVQLVFNEALGRKANNARLFNVYVDEFPLVATSDFARLLSEARKFAVGTTLAHQARGQIGRSSSDPNRWATIALPNAVIFRVNSEDAPDIARTFDPEPSERATVLAYDPYGQLERSVEQYSPRLQRAFATVSARLIDVEAAAEADAKQGLASESGRLTMKRLREAMRQYLAAANQGEDWPDVLAQIATQTSPPFASAVAALAAAINEEPVRQPQRGEESLGPVAALTRELQDLDRYQARCKLLVGSVPVQQTISTVAFQPLSNDPEVLARIERIRARSRQLYATPRTEVEADMRARLALGGGGAETTPKRRRQKPQRAEERDEASMDFPAIDALYEPLNGDDE